MIPVLEPKSTARYPWCIVRCLSDTQQVAQQEMVGRFRSLSDAEGYLKVLRQSKPSTNHVIVFKLA